MKNEHGQALIEFLIILPILIMLIFSFVDFGKIILENNRLESLTSMVIAKSSSLEEKDLSIYLENLGYDNIDLSIQNDGDLLYIKLSKNIDIMTPGLNLILGNKYLIEVERVVQNEK